MDVLIPISNHIAGVIQLVECQLPKLDVAGSSPVARSRNRNSDCRRIFTSFCVPRLPLTYLRAPGHSSTRSAMNLVKYASALLALELISVGCKDKAPPTPPSVAAVATPVPPAADPAAPDSFRVKFATTKGDFTVNVTRAWAPRGADRFYRLVTEGE